METYRVKVFGNEYSVRADRDARHVSDVASIVDTRMREIDQQFGQGSATRTAVLAGMNLVDEGLRREEKTTRWLEHRVGALIDKLETVL